MTQILYLAFYIPLILFSITLHEFAHAFSAYKMGDPTPKFYRRLSINPIKHIDLIGTIIFPLFLILLNYPIIGWAKPVPVNDKNFKNKRLGRLIVASSGPLSNLFLALILVNLSYLTYVKSSPFISTISESFYNAFLVNIVLFSFNILPVPSLDGFGIIEAFLPDSLIDSSRPLYRYFLASFLLLLFLTDLRKVFSQYIIYPLVYFFEKVLVVF